MVSFKDRVFLSPKEILRPSARIVFVSDLFVEDYVGGAELTSEALIEESPYEIQKVHSKDVNLSLLSQGADKYWIFGNFAQLNPELIPSIVANIKYSVLEYDYKYCKYRSPEKHFSLSGKECDCHNQINGKLISAFYYGAKSLFWMSEAQKYKYTTLFPFLLEKDNIILSSVFSKNILGVIQALRFKQQTKTDSWLVLGSDSWVKGANAAKLWCEENHKNYEVVWNVTYDVILDKLSKSEGFVYLPAGADTCPRMVIEAKLLGCKLHINNNVQHATEEWFASDDLDSIVDYLSLAPGIFWSAIKQSIDYKPRISGYTTTYNCVSQGYPFIQSIKSMLQFCDEVCIVDGGSIDGTWEKLVDILLETKNKSLDDLNDIERISTIDMSKPGALGEMSDGKRIRIKQISRDWTHPRHAVFDGMQKAEARAMCTGDFCWQMDSDEIVHEDDANKVSDFCQKMPKNIDIVALPVVEYWGGPDKVRCDIQPWKWRLSRNLPHITHGIPKNLRVFDEMGVYALPGTDGCDMIDKETHARLPHVTFHAQETEKLRQMAAAGDVNSLQKYNEWFISVINNLPGVYHYSWFDIARKIRLYRDYWTRHWVSLNGKSYEDTAQTNMMFDVPWAEVTEEMIVEKAKELSEKTGGHIWHSKWNGKKTPWLTINKNQPRVML